MDFDDVSSIYDDEIIPDSDEEGIARPLLVLPKGMVSNITQDTISIAPDPTTMKRFPISSIIDEAAGSSSSATKQRPKPRPIAKRPEASSSKASPPTSRGPAFPTDTQMETEFRMANIAERAKMRARNTKPQTQQPIGPSSDIIELTSDDDDDDFDIIPASKRRKAVDKTKAKPTGKKSTSSKSSSSVDTPPDPQPRPRPKPRPLNKNNQGKSSDAISPIQTMTQNNLIPTSSISNNTFPIPFKLLPSQLPPSDPPSSTATTYDHPPIAILPQTHTGHDPSSSQPTLVSANSSGKKKRKRVMSHIDELDSDPDPLASNIMDVDTRLMPPPPSAFSDPPATFFAGSSSPMHQGRPKNVTPIVTKKPRKKKSVDTDDENDTWGAKPKVKPRQKKIPAKKVVEVVIEQPKGKGKEKEVFKSREFIDDDDDDDPLDQVAAKTGTTSIPKPDSLTSLSSAPDSDTDSLPKAKPSMKRKDDKVGGIEGNNDTAVPRRDAVQGKRVIISDDEDDTPLPAEPRSATKANGKGRAKDKPAKAKATPMPPKTSGSSSIDQDDDPSPKHQAGSDQELSRRYASKENEQPPPPPNMPQTPKPPEKPVDPLFPSLSSRYIIAPKTKATPMSDLIRRVNSKPGSPFCSPVASGARVGTPGIGMCSGASTAYSPYVKGSRSALSRIAPLHPNRRTPPPPLPPPPPKKKTKKELEREEQWEEELVESVGGITEWACMSDAERREMRKAKREREMYGWED